MDEGKLGAIAKVIRRNPKTGQREFGELVTASSLDGPATSPATSGYRGGW